MYQHLNVLTWISGIWELGKFKPTGRTADY